MKQIVRFSPAQLTKINVKKNAEAQRKADVEFLKNHKPFHQILGGIVKKVDLEGSIAMDIIG